MSSVKRHLRRSVKFWQPKEKWVAVLILNSKNKVDLIPRLSETLNKPLGVGLINFSNKFLKTSYGTDLQLSDLNYSIP